MEIYGDLDSASYSFWALQIHPCVDQPIRRSRDSFSEEQIQTWSDVHGINDESIFGLETCKSSSEIQSFFDSNLLTLYANNTQVDNLIEQIVTVSELLDVREKIFSVPISGLNDNKVIRVGVQENTLINQIDENILYVNLGGEAYTTIISEEITDQVQDSALLTGYNTSILIGRDRGMAQTITIQYDNTTFITELGGSTVFLFVVTRFLLYMIWPLTSVIESKLMQQVYHTNPNENMKKSELKESIEQSSNSLDQSGTELVSQNRLRDRLTQQIRAKIQQQVLQKAQEVSQNQNQYSQLLKQLQANGQAAQYQEKSRIKLFLSSAILRRPKFSEISVRKLCFSCNRSKKTQLKINRLKQGQKMLNKDLDVSTYIRTVAKVRGLVQALLDDKQRIMLKYYKGRLIQAKKNDDDYELQNKEEQIQISDTMKAADLVFSRFYPTGGPVQGSVNEVDQRFMKAMHTTWRVDERPLKSQAASSNKVHDDKQNAQYQQNPNFKDAEEEESAYDEEVPQDFRAPERSQPFSAPKSKQRRDSTQKQIEASIMQDASQSQGAHDTEDSFDTDMIKKLVTQMKTVQDDDNQ